MTSYTVRPTMIQHEERLACLATCAAVKLGMGLLMEAPGCGVCASDALAGISLASAATDTLADVLTASSVHIAFQHSAPPAVPAAPASWRNRERRKALRIDRPQEVLSPTVVSFFKTSKEFVCLGQVGCQVG